MLRNGGAGEPSFTVEISSDPSILGGWDGLATPFQDATWLSSWYEALRPRPGLTPLLITVREARTGTLALRLPLILSEAAGRRTIAFADLGLTDYNAPLLGPAAPDRQAGTVALWRAIRKSLPAADLLTFAKMPLILGDRPNPLALLPGARPCALNGNAVATGDDWDGYRRSLVRTVRKELERSWRVFLREADTQFRIVTDLDEADRVLVTMAHQQGSRMRALGSEYVLDEAEFDAFYRILAARGLDSGYAVVTALLAGDVVVAALLGIRRADTYVMIRISNAGEGWTNCSPGRLIIERTMAALHADGCRTFDFSIGDYDYKRRFGVTPLPLVDVTKALTWRGRPASLRAALAGWLRSHPELDRRVRRVAARLVRRPNGVSEPHPSR